MSNNIDSLSDDEVRQIALLAETAEKSSFDSLQLSARIGDALSTYNEGIISAMNEPARSKGIDIGMTAKEALRSMLV